MSYEDTQSRPVNVPPGYQVGRWRVGELLGDGGWGSVYAGEPAESGEGERAGGSGGEGGGDAVAGGSGSGSGSGDEDGGADDGPVALKFLPPARLGAARRSLLGEIVERETEFSQLADHPNLIRTRAVLTLSEPGDPNLDGAVVLVMDRAETSLRELLIEANAGTALPEAERILVEVCRGLADMHSHSWIHGDLKPSNVLLMSDGSVRLADFGLTARVEGTHAYVPRIGSSDYLPPEWWSERVGERGIPQRPSADVWAFGVLAHQVLTGGLYPFPGSNSQARAFAVQAFARGAAQLRLDGRIPAAWRALITDCLSPDQSARSRISVDQVLEAAEAIRSGGAYAGSTAGGGNGAGVGAGGGYSASGRVSRLRLRVLLGTASITALAAAAGGLWVSVDGTPKPAASPSARVGSLGPHAAVPAQYRDMITTAANLCDTSTAVSPALIAGLLKAISGFDPNYSSPQTESYGIAGWTPSVFHAWTKDPRGDYMKPKDAISTAAEFLCWLDGRFTQAKVPGDHAALLAAGYETSDMTVIRANGVPAKLAGFANTVTEYAREFEQ